jgi:hypothetical protein
MPSTYSDLKIELIATGEQSNTWGTTTNNNLGVAIEQAIVGKADVTMSSTTVTLTLTDSNALQDARALYLNLSGTPGGAATLEVPAIEKNYIVKNGSDEQVTIKVSGQTGVAIPTGKTALVYNNGTDVVTAVDYIPSLALGTALPITSGGTGSTSTTFVNLATNVTGTLPVANGGTGITSFGTGVATWLGTPSSANLAAALTDETGSGLAVFSTTPTITGLREKSTAVSASDIDLSAGNYFTKTISGTTTFTVSNVASSGDVAAFILVLTNGGAYTVNYFSGVTWAGGTAPTLTASGVDVLGFFTINGGTTWRGLVLALDIKAP